MLFPDEIMSIICLVSRGIINEITRKVNLEIFTTSFLMQNHSRSVCISFSVSYLRVYQYE